MSRVGGTRPAGGAGWPPGTPGPGTGVPGRRRCGGAPAGDQARAGRVHQRAAAAAEGAPALPRVRSRAEHGVQRAVRGHSAGRHRTAAPRHRLHELGGCGPDPGPDDRGGLLPPLRRGRRAGVDGGHQRGSAPVVGRAWPGSARPDHLPGRRRHHRAHLWVTQAGHGHLLQGDLGVRPTDRVAGQHQGGALPGQPARNAPSHAGAADWIDRAIELVAPHTERVCLRGDTDFSLTANFDKWAKRADFIFGMDTTAALRSRAEALDEAAWSRLDRPAGHVSPTGVTRARREDHKQRIVTERGYLELRLDHEDVAEFGYQPGKCARPYRVVAVRKNISKARGEQVLIEDIRYFFYITTRTDLTDAQVVACANERCDQENIIGQLKSGVNALRVPLYDLVSNWAYMLIATLAWNLKSWFAMMMHRKADRRDYIRMEFRRFLHGIILIPAMVSRRARTITVRLIGYQPSLDRLFSAWNTIERTRFG